MDDYAKFVSNTCSRFLFYLGISCIFLCPESVGLCSTTETSNPAPVILVTFGNGTNQYSSATPFSFGFVTSYAQKVRERITDGQFAFINAINDDFQGAWHTGAKDHTTDENGYMMLVNAANSGGRFYYGVINELCVGQRYEFSVYLANVCTNKSRCPVDPNVRFEMRSMASDFKLLAEYSSGDVPINETTMVWKQYGFSFIPSSSSVILLIISSVGGSNGNDVALDDIALRLCSRENNTSCPAT